jgi:hypothetical protein
VGVETFIEIRRRYASRAWFVRNASRFTQFASRFPGEVKRDALRTKIQEIETMSEFQCYQFRKIDGSLSDEAIEEISDLSSRAEVSSTSALFTYDYGDFPADPLKVLMKHFDALFYTANWGTRRLAFRFPKFSVNQEVLSRFAFEEKINIEGNCGHLIVDLFFDDDSFSEWFDEGRTLDRVIGVYDDLLAGDYRPLFLSWLQAVLVAYGWNPDVTLGPIPPGLNELVERHRMLIDLFEIDLDLIAAAASFSDPIQQVSNEDLAEAIESMPVAQQAAFLRRMVLGESPAIVTAELRRHLRSNPRFAKTSDVALATPPPSTAVLFAKGRQISEDRRRQAREQKVALERQRFEAIERDEKKLWQRVDSLIAEKNIKGYDQAVSILKDLRELAVHKQQWEEFALRVQAIQAKHSRLPGLLWRIQSAKLLEND